MLKDFNPNVVQQRATRLDTTIDKETRIFKQAALSSEIKVNRAYGDETLIHSRKAINMDRAKDGLPLLFMHDPTKPIGRVRNVKLGSDNKLRGDIEFSKNHTLANETFSDVVDGMLSDISLGYTIQDYNETGDGIDATSWTPREASIVTLSHDPQAGIHRSDDGVTSTEEIAMLTEKEKKEIADKAIAEDRAKLKIRSADINQAFEHFSGNEFEALKTRAINEPDFKIDDIRKELLTLAGEGIESRGGVITHADDEHDRFNRGVIESLECKVGTCRDDKVIKSIRQNEFFGMTIGEIARRCLELNNMTTRGLNKSQIIGNALTMRAVAGVLGVADFPNILANVTNSSMQLAYEEAEETWRLWCSIGNLSDFKLTDMPNLTAFDTLPIVADKDAYTTGDLNDLKEQIQLATYGKLLRISRQALINDNLNALGSIPAKMGRAAARTVGNLPYAILEANANMLQDTTALFEVSTHANDIDDAGAGPTNAHVESGRLAMAAQQDPDAKATLGIRPMHMLVPTNYGTQGRVLMKAEYEPGTTPGNLQPNPHQDAMGVIEEHRIAAGDWFMVGSKNLIETVEVAFLDGQDSPTLEQDDPFTHDGVDFKVRIDAAAAAKEWRGMVRFSNLP